MKRLKQNNDCNKIIIKNNMIIDELMTKYVSKNHNMLSLASCSPSCATEFILIVLRKYRLLSCAEMTALLFLPKERDESYPKRIFWIFQIPNLMFLHWIYFGFPPLISYFDIRLAFEIGSIIFSDYIFLVIFLFDLLINYL